MVPLSALTILPLIERVHRSGGALLISASLPGDKSKLIGLPSASATAWILVVSPPQERPISAKSPPFSHPPRADALARWCCPSRCLAYLRRCSVLQILKRVRHFQAVLGRKYIPFPTSHTFQAYRATVRRFALSTPTHSVLFAPASAVCPVFPVFSQENDALFFPIRYLSTHIGAFSYPLCFFPIISYFGGFTIS